MVAIGNIYPTPEVGWSRFEETDKNIVYIGTFNIYSSSGASEGTIKYSSSADSEIRFNFTGTSIRLIGTSNSDRSNLISITIDGQEYTFSEHNSLLTFRVAVFEKLNLKDTVHYVVIKRKSTSGIFDLDAIDLLNGNTLFPYKKLTGKALIRDMNKSYWYYDANLLKWQELGLISLSNEIIDTYGMLSISEEIQYFDEKFDLIVWSDEEFISPKITCIPLPQLIYPTSDISLVGVEFIDKLTVMTTGDAKIAISFDRGITWKSFKNGLWIVVESAHDGMTSLELNSLTRDQIELARNDSTNVRFSYSLSNDAEVDNIEMKVTLQGYEKLANTKDFDIDYDVNNNKIIYKIKKSGSYSINFIDI